MKAETPQTLTITVLEGPPQVKTRDDVGKMTFVEFAHLTAVSIQDPDLHCSLPCFHKTQSTHMRHVGFCPKGLPACFCCCSFGVLLLMLLALTMLALLLLLLLPSPGHISSC